MANKTVQISHPAIGQSGQANFSRIYLGPLTIWFSYETPIGYAFPGLGTITRENDWSTVTGKHLRNIPGDNKASRIPGEQFEKQLAEITIKIETALNDLADTLRS